MRREQLVEAEAVPEVGSVGGCGAGVSQLCSCGGGVLCYGSACACSTGPSGGNQVDGLPPARHTEAVWGVQGPFGPAPIGAHAKKNIVNIFLRMLRCPNVLGIY